MSNAALKPDSHLHSVVMGTVKIKRAGDPAAMRESLSARLDREEAEFRAMQLRKMANEDLSAPLYPSLVAIFGRGQP